VTAVGGWSVKLYINMDEVVAMVSLMLRKLEQLQEVPRSDAGWLQGVSSRIELTRQLVASHRVLEALRGGELKNI
jgi:hypothetical protein